MILPWKIRQIRVPMPVARWSYLLGSTFVTEKKSTPLNIDSDLFLKLSVLTDGYS